MPALVPGCVLEEFGKDLGGRPPLASRCISLSWLFFHGGNTGSNPVGDANHFPWSALGTLSCFPGVLVAALAGVPSLRIPT